MYMNEKRTKPIPIRFTDAELERIFTKMNECFFTNRSEFLRALIFRGLRQVGKNKRKIWG